MQIDIVSDVMCPWSFMGKRWLDQALARRPGIRADITWRPFQINPELTSAGMDRDAYFAGKFGSAATGRRAFAALAVDGIAAGIAFAFERIRRIPNTRDAHRLIRYAAARAQADAAVEAVFRAYFLEGRDIGDAAVLAEIAGEIGLDTADVADFLAGSAEIAQVLAEARDVERSGIGVVPCFIFNRRYAIVGAHEPEVLLPVIDAAEQDGPAQD